MKLFLSLTAACAVLRCTVPGPGAYTIIATDNCGNRQVVASGYAWGAGEATVRLKATNRFRVFVGKWEPDL